MNEPLPPSQLGAVLADRGLAAVQVGPGWLALGRAAERDRLLGLPGADLAELGPTTGALPDLLELAPPMGLRASRLIARLLPGAVAIRVGAQGPRLRRPAHPAWDALVGRREPLLTLPFAGPGDLPVVEGPLALTETRLTVRSGKPIEIESLGSADAACLHAAARIHLLCVCTGNTCRSPMLASLLACEVERRGLTSVHIESAGTFAAEDVPPSEHAAACMHARGLDLSRHRSRPVDGLELALYDRILCMTPAHADFLRHLGVPGHQLAPVIDGGVPDPFGGSLAAYEECAQSLEAAAIAIVDQL